MSALQFEEVSNDASITGFNDGIESQLSRLLLRQNKSIMKMARNRAWRMAIMHQTPFEKELPKALKEIISKLSVEFRKRKQNSENKNMQIKLQESENTNRSCNIGEAEKNAEFQAYLSPEIKLILHFRPDISVEQALIKQRFLNELKESNAKGNLESKQSNELSRTETAEVRSEDGNN